MIFNNINRALNSVSNTIPIMDDGLFRLCDQADGDSLLNATDLTDDLISLCDQAENDSLLTAIDLTCELPMPTMPTVRTPTFPASKKRSLSMTTLPSSLITDNNLFYGLEQNYALVKVCTHWKGGDFGPSHWHQKDLEIVGVYESIPAAEAAKSDLIEKHKCGDGRGDDRIGDSQKEVMEFVIEERLLKCTSVNQQSKPAAEAANKGELIKKLKCEDGRGDDRI
jgi:hypothetical protein